MIEPEPYKDSRGLLRRNFCRRELEFAGLDFEIQQANISENIKANTLRGFHLQLPPYQETKQISCVRGAIYGIVLDLRPESQSFCQWFSYECDGDNRLSIIVPQGCASAYLTLKPDTWILYYHSEFYMPGYEMGIRYNDRYFDFEWPEEPVVISDKDNSYPDYHLGNFLDRFSDR